MDSPVLVAARLYVEKKLSVIPIRADGSKAPALARGDVEQYRERFPTDEELVEWFAPHKAVGLAVVCGKISGNLAVIDFENIGIWNRWHAALVERDLADVINGCPIVKTPKGGRHVYCRLEQGWVAGGQLAKLGPKELLIEIRGQGHYVLAPGCPPACHPLNIPYAFVDEGWIA